MITVINSGVSNIGSVLRAIERVGETAHIAQSPDDVLGAESIILPGVGAFPASMNALDYQGLTPALHQAAAQGTPILGICLGMQMLMDSSEEGATTSAGIPGLGIIPGRVLRLDSGNSRDRVPNVGWCDVTFSRSSVLSTSIPAPSTFYFTHSYAVKCEDQNNSLGTISFGGSNITVAVQRDNVFGVQFHSEKSQSTGLTILHNFSTFARKTKEFQCRQ